MNKGFCKIDIGLLVKAHWNYKEDNDELAKKLENNIRRNGQIENIIVRELDDGKFEIVNGNHRLDVMKNIGIDGVHCYNLGQISEVDAKRIAVETNETRFSTDSVMLKKVLLDIKDVYGIEDMIKTIPFPEQELMHLDDEYFGDLKEPSYEQEEPEIFDGFVVVIKATHESMEEIEPVINDWKVKYGLEINIS